MTKAMRKLAATQNQRSSSGNTSSGGKSKKKDKDNKRSKKDKRRSSPALPAALPATAAATSNKNRSHRPSSRAQPVIVSKQQVALPAYWSEYDRVVKRLAEEERALVAAQRRLEVEVSSELDKRRTRREKKEEQKSEELNFVARFLLSGTSGKNGIALRRSEEEKQKERERRQLGLPMYGGSGGEEEEEADVEDESSHEDEDEDEEDERKRRKQQRLQRRKERREAKEAREAAERARVDELLVDETVPFVTALTMRFDADDGNDDDEKTARPTGQVKVAQEEHKEAEVAGGEVQEVKVKEEKMVEKKEEETMGQPIWIVNSEGRLFDEPPPSMFDGVEQDAWEKRIVWEDEQVKAEDEERQERQAVEERRQRSIAALKAEDVPVITPAATSSSLLSFSSFSPPSLSSFSATSQHRPLITLTWLKSVSPAERERIQRVAFERTNRPQPSLLPAPTPSTDSTHNNSSQWKGVVLHPVSQSTNSSVVSGQRLLSHRINQSLLTDDWVNAIVWDETDLHQKRSQLLQHHALLLDQNDPQLLLASTHTLTHLSQTAVAAPSLLDQFKRYNISHDAVQGSDTLSLRVLKILHAVFAANLDPLVYRTHLTSTELAHYHRPLLSFQADVSTTMAIKAEGAAASVAQGDEREQQARYVPRTMEELSASDGDIIVCEYLERYPPLLMNVGMCSQLITYYRKQDELDIHQPEAPDGDVVVLTTKDDSPFLSNLKPGQTVTALTNNMYISPVVRHTPTQHTFLLVRVVGQNYWTVRALPSGCYIVGQQEPKISVPYPDRSHAFDLLKKQLEVFIYKRMRYNKRKIKPDDINREFGHTVVVDTIARRILKDIATFDRNAGVWHARLPDDKWPNEEKLQLLCTPEDVCAYEAMRAADSRLKEAGVRRFTNVKQISDIIDQLTQDDVSRVAIYIEKQLHLMPWTLTKGFLAAVHCFGHGMQLLLHAGGSVAVERVVVGDRLIGGDGHPVLVTAVMAGVAMGAESLWTLRMKDFTLKQGSYSTHDDVVVTDNHFLELVTWRRLHLAPNNSYYWHHFRPYPLAGQQHPPGGGWVPVPMGDTSVWTGEYSYRVVHRPQLTAAAFRRHCASLRLNFRGVRWSVTVAAYVAQLTAIGRGLPWPKYDGSPRCNAACRGPQGCRQPADHNIPHSKTWWALYQPAPDRPVQFNQSGRSLHDRILQLFGAGTADPWAAPDNQQQARWLLEDTYQMAWLIGFWLADGDKMRACIIQVENDIFGGDDHDEAVEGIRQLASLVARLRLFPGVARAALMTHAQFWNVNPQPAFLPLGHPWLVAPPPHMGGLMATRPEQLMAHFGHIGLRVDAAGNSNTVHHCQLN